MHQVAEDLLENELIHGNLVGLFGTGGYCSVFARLPIASAYAIEQPTGKPDYRGQLRSVQYNGKCLNYSSLSYVELACVQNS